jgi:predicted nucleotidyltransferase
MIGWYSSGTHLDRLYGPDMGFLSQYDFDPALAGAWLLGSPNDGTKPPPAQ